jgi:hypothetical protein
MSATRCLILGFVLGIVAMLVLQVWQDHRPSTPAAPAHAAPELRGERTTVAECKPIVIYRDKVKQELGLPADVQADVQRQVVAATKVPASDRPHTVSAVADLGTGKVDLFVRPDPLPWFRRENVWSRSLYAGVYDKDFTARMTVERSAVQIKRAHIGAVFAVDAGPGETRLFIGIGGRF